MPWVVIGAGILAYLGSFRGVFLFDDLWSIVQNPAIRRWDSAWGSLAANSNNRPLVWLSFALNYAISGSRPWSYHLFNLVVHLLAALTLFAVVARTLRTPRFPRTTPESAHRFALVVALLWTLHPLQTESVTYVYQRAESMMGLFVLLTLCAAIRGAESKRPAPWHAAAVLACALGMGCKAAMISAPIVVLLYDHVFLSGSFAAVLRRRWPLHAGLFATWVVLGATGAAGLVLHPTAAQRQVTTVGLGYARTTPLQYALTQPGVILHYLRLSVWPHPLCLDYWWPLAKTMPSIVLPSLVVAALLAGTILSFRRLPALGFAGAWFFLVLAPTSSVVPVEDPAFEHRMYLPLAGVIALLAVAAGALLRRAGESLRWSPGARRAAAVALLALAAGALGVLTILRQRDYRSEEIMWAKIAGQRPGNPRAHDFLGVLLGARGEVDEAIAQFREAIRLKPDAVEAYDNLGFYLERQGRFDEAVAQTREAIRLEPGYAGSHYNLGCFFASRGRLEEAIPEFREAARLKPDFLDAHANLALALARAGRLNEAMAPLRRALELDPGNAQANRVLAWVRLRMRTAAPAQGPTRPSR
ncbi:MAG TPA: tetratricopeptide repeat protein [Terriglobales bacterium]|nr:tetratricopeptide repeat protein [Terriglobales bacterium]